MALDGIFLNLLKSEIKEKCIGAKVDKVHQPSKSELILIMRQRNKSFKLLLSSSGNAPRIHMTDHSPENPEKPPKFCMLLRKHLGSAVLTDIRQEGLDRILYLHFDAISDIGQKVSRILVIEIMAQYSNIILLDEENTILDSIRRIDNMRSSVRQILPGLKYNLPPAQNKIDIRKANNQEIGEILKLQEGKNLSSALLSCLEGFSPLLCREISHRAYGDDINITKDLDFSSLFHQLEILRTTLKNKDIRPCVASFEDGKPLDFSFIEISQYGKAANCSFYDSLSSLLDSFYYEKEKFERLKSRAEDIFRLINQAIERTSKKLNIQKAELTLSEDREGLRLFAELIQANLYKLEKGQIRYIVENYYDNNQELKIPVKPYLTPIENSQLYFKKYRKAQRAEEILTKQIDIGEKDLEYFFSVLDSLSRAETEAELSEIRGELQNGGYLKRKIQKSKQKRQKALPPIEFISPNGFKVLVGRNNIQNDRLSFKIASKTDIWFHAQKMPGSHVVLILENRNGNQGENKNQNQSEDMSQNKNLNTNLNINQNVNENENLNTNGNANQNKNINQNANEPKAADIEFAASIAAYYSSGRQSQKLSIDYTQIKNLKKPNGSKPGFVIYHVYKTVQIKPYEPVLGEKL